MLFKFHDKPGRGINKRDPNQPRLLTFFEIFPGKLWKLFKLDLLHLLVSLPFFGVTMLIAGVITAPVVDEAVHLSSDIRFLEYDIWYRIVIAFLFLVFIGMGPVTAGFTYVLREFANETPCMLTSDYWEHFRLNIKQSVGLWLIDLAALYVFSVSIRFYGVSGNTLLQCIMMAFAVVYVLMHIYSYQMMITYDLSLKDILKNSLLLTFGKAPVSLLILLMNVVLYLIIPIITIMNTANILILGFVLILEVFLFPAVSGFITSFCISPILEKYVRGSNE